MSKNFYKDNPDLRFYVEKYLDWQPLIALTEWDFKTKRGFKDDQAALKFYKGVLNSIGEFAAKKIAPRAREIDEDHPRLENGQVIVPQVTQEIFDHLKELDLFGMTLPLEVGGMNCPLSIFLMSHELFSRADVSMTAHFGFHGGMALAMFAFSILEGTSTFDLENFSVTSTRFRAFIDEIIEGDAWGSMDITEPAAGSDMAALTTRGFQDEEGNWFVSGQKIFITSGHAKYHFVMARTEECDPDDPFAGLEGLSLFLVPAYKYDEEGNFVPLARFEALEKKLGHHGSATVAVSFDKTPAFLLGKRGEGFKLMLRMMNNARIGVGFESLGICEAAYRMAKAYAAKRSSMGKTIDRHEMIADYLDEMRTDIQGIRALAAVGAYHEELSQRLNLRLHILQPEGEERRGLEKRLKYHRGRSRQITPLIKYLAAEKAVEIARRNIQIHGGYGYSSEYGAEKLLRDAMVLPIYEGTSQIQSLMAMKDTLMGVLKAPKVFLKEAGQTFLRSRRSESPLERRVARLQLYKFKAIQYLIFKLVGAKMSDVLKKPVTEWESFVREWDPRKDFALPMLHAERLTRLLADVTVVELLFDQAQKFPEERKEVLVRYLERAEPRCAFLYSEITRTGQRLLESLEEGRG